MRKLLTCLAFYAAAASAFAEASPKGVMAAPPGFPEPIVLDLPGKTLHSSRKYTDDPRRFGASFTTIGGPRGWRVVIEARKLEPKEDPLRQTSLYKFFDKEHRAGLLQAAKNRADLFVEKQFEIDQAAGFLNGSFDGGLTFSGHVQDGARFSGAQSYFTRDGFMIGLLTMAMERPGAVQDPLPEAVVGVHNRMVRQAWARTTVERDGRRVLAPVGYCFPDASDRQESGVIELAQGKMPEALRPYFTTFASCEYLMQLRQWKLKNAEPDGGLLGIFPDQAPDLTLELLAQQTDSSWRADTRRAPPIFLGIRGQVAYWQEEQDGGAVLMTRAMALSNRSAVMVILLGPDARVDTKKRALTTAGVLARINAK